jgi:RNA polymerase sigma-70 factor (ECF subfamily)
LVTAGTQPKEPTDEQLMLLIGKGNRKAFEMLYDRYFEKLVSFAFRICGDTHQAEDTVQEVFIQIIEKPGQFQTDKKFSTWVYTITGNASRNVLRNTQNRARLAQENATSFLPKNTEITHHFDYRLLREKLESIYQDLNDKEKNIFILRFEQELSIREIADIVNIPEGSVKSGIFYLLKKLSYHLKEFTNER